MVRFLYTLVVLLALVAPARAQEGPATVQPAGARVALVIGSGAYAKGALPTATHDAGLLAQTLAAAGFDVTAARDLDAESIRRAFREFLQRAGAAGPNAIAFVYLSGHGLQFDGDNYLVPVDARIGSADDIPTRAIRLSGLTHALAALPLRARVVVLDAAYDDPNVPGSARLAPGLALVDPEPGLLIAFNAAPGAVAARPAGSYGAFAEALAEMMRAGGVSVEDVFARARLRVNRLTRGADVPWNAAKLPASFLFFDRAPDAPAVASAQLSFAAMAKRPVREFPSDEAYSIALARDTLAAYQDFLAAYPDSPAAAQVRVMLAIRREALIWRRSVGRNSPEAYWTYLQRYPRGPHVHDAGRRLTLLAAAVEPPARFPMTDDGVPPPPEAEVRIVAAGSASTGDANFPPPPPPSIMFLPPAPGDLAELRPPLPPVGPRFLPMPAPIPIPYAKPIVPPGVVTPPQGVSGSYAQPQPFATAPSGGVMARLGRPEAGAPTPSHPTTTAAIPLPPPAAAPEASHSQPGGRQPKTTPPGSGSHPTMQPRDTAMKQGEPSAHAGPAAAPTPKRHPTAVPSSPSPRGKQDQPPTGSLARRGALPPPEQAKAHMHPEGRRAAVVPTSRPTGHEI